MKTLNISIVEDSQEFRSALEELINAAEGFSCISVFGNGESALKKIPKQLPDVVLVDIGLPGISGIELIRNIKIEVPKIQFMVLTVSEAPDKIFKALSAGASGYLLKGTEHDEILDAIRELANGGSPMSSQIARKVVNSFQLNRKVSENPYDKILTKRQKEVLMELSNGLLYKNIASKLSISIETVKTHCHNIYDKLHATTRTEAINIYKNGYDSEQEG